MLTTEYLEMSCRMPAYDFIAEQSDEVIEKILREKDKLEKYDFGFLLKDEVIKKIHQYPLYELRVKAGKMQFRLIFTVKGSTAWFVSGFIKKTKKTPKNEMEKALVRAKNI